MQSRRVLQMCMEEGWPGVDVTLGRGASSRCHFLMRTFFWLPAVPLLQAALDTRLQEHAQRGDQLRCAGWWLPLPAARPQPIHPTAHLPAPAPWHPHQS